MFYCPELGRFFARDMIRRPAENPYVYCGSSAPNGADPTGLWQENGHFFTVYMVARSAGMNHKDAYALAYYSQLPDELNRTDAKTKGVEHATRGLEHLELGDLAESWRQDVNNYLHSLHGGDIQKRRECLIAMLKDETLKTWERGFVLHALGDAFAHTYTENGQLKAYEWTLGHLKDWQKPDTIRENVSQYNQYVDVLFGVLGGSDKSSLNPLLAGVAAMNNWRIPGSGPITVDDENYYMQSLARLNYPELAQELYSPIPPAGSKTDTQEMRLDKRMDNLSPARIRELLDKMKAACDCK